MKDDKRLKRKVRNSYIVSTVSITLVLFLLGSVGYLMVAALKVADTLQESIAVTVELKNGLSEAQKETISKRLTAEEMVATIAYSAKEEKAEEEEFRKMFGSSFEEILPENPLLDSFELTLTSASSDKELLDSFIAAAGRIEGVDRVSYPALMAERLHATVNKIQLVLAVFDGSQPLSEADGETLAAARGAKRAAPCRRNAWPDPAATPLCCRRAAPRSTAGMCALFPHRRPACCRRNASGRGPCWAVWPAAA